MDINKAIISGRLTQNPQPRTATTGKSVTSLTIATNQTWPDDSGKIREKTEYHNVLVWGKLADNADQYLVKGQEVYIEGRHETSYYEGKDGIQRAKSETVVSGPGSCLKFGRKPTKASEST